MEILSLLPRHEKIHQRARKKTAAVSAATSRVVRDGSSSGKVPPVDDDDFLYAHCEYCGKRFACSTALKQHINYVHKKQFDNVKCETCGQEFERRTQLNRLVKVNFNTYRTNFNWTSDWLASNVEISFFQA